MKKRKLLTSALAACMMLTPLASSVSAAAVEVKMQPTLEALPTSELLSMVSKFNVSGAVMGQAILKLKELVGDTSDYKNFDYGYSEGEDGTVFELYWSGSEERGDLSITVASDGTVLNYSAYVDYRVDGIVIPEITKAEALATAIEFALKVNPKYASTISAENATVSYNDSGMFTVVLNRYHNGVNVDGEIIRMRITSTGHIYSMDASSMAANVKLPEAVEDADIATIKASILADYAPTLEYYTYYPTDADKKAEVKLRYAMPSGLNSILVDAVTGEIYEQAYETGALYSSANGGMSDAVVEESAAETESAVKYTLSEAELNAAALQDSFIGVEAALLKVASLVGFTSSEGYELASNVLRRSESIFTDKISYIYDFKATHNGSSTDLIRATVDAQTGEVYSISANGGDIAFKAVSERKYDDAECRDAAMKFLETNFPEASAEYILDDSYLNREYAPTYRLSSYYYVFTRTMNGVKYTPDSVTIHVNPDTLEITHFDIKRSDAEFVSPDRVISPEKALDSYFAKLDPTPIYKTVGSYGDGKITFKYSSYNLSDKLTMAKVYDLNAYVYIDAFGGKLIRSNGRDYELSTTVNLPTVAFTDIEKSPYRTAIELLANMDYIASTAKFRPTAEIKVGEFIDMFSRIGSGYQYINSFDEESGEKYDENAKLSREEAAKIIITSLGHAEIAELEGIFKCDYTDADKISEGYVGYVAIAKALGLLDAFGDTLAPSKTLTRGEAAQIVYDYLLNQRK